jgi:hypothetical protein
MEVYKTLKYAIKIADIGLLRRAFVRCSVLFQGASKKNYAFLSLYMTWLTGTPAADEPLQRAILANGLVNLRGSADSWFEIDRLNEFFSLQMKMIMATRRTSTEDTINLFRQTALTTNYCTDLRQIIESVFGRYIKGKHQEKNAREDVRGLACHLNDKGSTIPHPCGRNTEFKTLDIITTGVLALAKLATR